VRDFFWREKEKKFMVKKDRKEKKREK
jgi:hypothetical protein